jgi:tetratricopeptide (TPR) repeat protein
MLKGRLRKFLYLLPVAIVLVITRVPLNASAETCEQWVAKAVSVEGRVEVKREGETQWQQVQLDETFCGGDQIRVLEESRADLSFANQPLLRLDQNTTITLAGIEEESSGIGDLFKSAAKLDLIEGAAHFFSRLPRNLEVRTGFVNAGVEGTEFFIRVADNSTTITVFEGKVLAANEAGSVGITSGQSAVAEAGKAPVVQVVAQPRDAVRWALHYPPVLDGIGPDTEVNQAAQLLAVGRVDEAGSKISQALGSDPANSGALSLQAIIAVVQNDKEAALTAANKAVEAAPESATALIALSYAQQAAFNLEAARANLEKAVALEPENALAWARLAELQSSFGDLDSALASAQKAVELNPNLSRTQTVLGFAYLTQIKTAMAKEAFNKAIELDQADSLPRLGLGLAKIRDGELEEGRREIEVAASLDSNSGLIRSYLGKAYYEEKRPELDGREYAIAKELDPNDPTPWFYDAIRKQTINQPVEALHDLQKAIELNDNRAVYRSKLSLDSDEAARQAALARVYSDLGFQQLALVEGWKSVNTDPTNYSAHRFLADSYSVRPRHEIARVSELLQSQLLQPINITPIQPGLGESNLFLISSQGAAQTSFNEFNPLFTSNRMTIQVSGLYGNNGTWGGEGIVSGVYNGLSLSAGYSHFETDGWRINSDQEDKIANFFAQYEISHKTSIQAEYRYRDSEYGDLLLKFHPESVYPDQRWTSENDTIRLGARHAFSPRSIILASYMHQDGEIRERHEPFPQPGVLLVDFPQPDQRSDGGELQYLSRSQSVNLTIGGGYYDVSDQVDGFVRLAPPQIPGPPFTPPTLDIPQNIGLDLEHSNLYLYSYLNFLRNMTITVGASYDMADSEYLNEDKNQFNPKFGVVWTPLPDTTLRVAAFRTLKRTLITQQTLEPTNVAGFNQFFDDEELVESRHYGGAIDQKFSSSIYGGLEYSYRELTVPYIDFTANLTPPPIRESNWDEYLGRVYLFWTPYDWCSLRAEYLYERLKREQPYVAGVVESKTHRIPLGINFFFSSGLSASLAGTYYNQKGEFGGYWATNPIQNGSDNFFIVDMAIKYRLPKRYGIITVGATNLFDEDFNYFDSDLNNASIQPGRAVFAKVTLALP